MTTEKFNELTEAQLNRCREILCKKAAEYATVDRLHNFKQASHLQHISPVAALGGMMCKHTVSVYDMIEGAELGKSYTTELWNEKITDSMNYLLLLWALINEHEKEEPSPNAQELPEED